MKVLFLGSSTFSKYVLEEMLSRGVNVTSVITQPDKPSGRGHKLMPTLIKTFALEKGIEVFTFDRLRKHMDEVKEIDYDISVVASFGQILPDEFLDYRFCINVHPSLLPKYRGATPLQSAILGGDKISGVTIMKVAREVDAGDIISQKEENIEGLYYSEVEEKLGKIGGEMVSEVIKNFGEGKLTMTPQDHSKAVLVSKLSKEDGVIDFNNSADMIVAKVRALSENVGTSFVTDGLKVKVERADKVEGVELEVGQIANNKKAFIIGCREGAIEIQRCKAESGKSMSGRDFLNGHNYLLGGKVDNA